MVQVLVNCVDIGVVTYEAMISHCGGQWFRSWLTENVGVVIYEFVTPQCGRSMVHVLVSRVDIGVVV